MRRRRNASCVLSLSMERTTVAIYVLSQNTLEPSIIYLEARAQRMRWPSRARAELGMRVEHLFLAVDAGTVASCTDPDGSTDNATLAIACKYVNE
jgi:hypothetical protein